MTASLKNVIDQERLANPPLSETSRIFFLKAMGMVGLAKYGEAWGDADRTAVDVPPMTNPPASADDWFERTKAFEPPHPESLRRNYRPARHGHLSMRAESEGQFIARLAVAAKKLADWQERQTERFDKRHELHAAAIAWQNSNARANKQLTSAFVGLRQAIIDEEIGAYFRGIKRGSKWLRLNPSEIVSPEIEGTLLRHGSIKWRYEVFDVFVERTGLEAWIAKQAHAPVVISESDISALPDPLKIAVKIALANPGVGALGLKDRDKLVRKAWKSVFPVESETYIEAIGTVLNSPDIERIKRSKERAVGNPKKMDPLP